MSAIAALQLRVIGFNHVIAERVRQLEERRKASPAVHLSKHLELALEQELVMLRKFRGLALFELMNSGLSHRAYLKFIEGYANDGH